MAQRTVLTVFLASPGDLRQEREEAHQVVRRLNRSIAAPLSWQIDLLGWEDTTPGYARPQEKINADVDKCDLFVGLIWQRWGQPTGTHTSGFHEEFERALDRRRRTQSPEIWLFFKRVPEDRIADPGDQLRQVLSFRKLQEDQRELLYQEFIDTEDWSKKFYDWLSSYTIRLSQAVPALNAEDSAPSHSEGASILSPDSAGRDGGEPVEASLQLGQILSALNSALQQNTDLSQSQVAVDPFLTSRLNLLSASLLSTSYSHDILGAHEVNILYKSRENLRLLHQERLMLLRTMIGNNEATAPGWYWFRSNRKGYLFFLLSLLAQGDSNSYVMEGAIRLLAATKAVPDKRLFNRTEFIRRIWEAAPREAAGYLSSVGTLKDLPALDALGTAASAETKIGILARIKPEEAFIYVLDSRVFPSPTVLEKLRIRSSALSDQTLLAALHNSNGSIRAIAFRELERRGEMTHTHATEGLRDGSAVIRQIALEWLIERGEQIDPKQIRDLLGNQPANPWPFLPDIIDSGRTISLSLKRLTREDLERFATWSALDGPIAYRILAENHFSAVGEVVRQDLRTKFARLKEDWVAEWQSLVGIAEAERHIAEMSKYDDLIRAQFAAAALSGLARNGTSNDRSLVISFLKSDYSFAALAAVRALQHIGLPEDSRALLELALSDGGQLRQPAASAAVYLSPGVNGPAADLLASNDHHLITLALVSLEPERLRAISERLESLLLHPHDSIRTCVLAFLVKKGSRKYLVDLLDRYLKNANYFYNVVCYLDRVLYSPEPLRRHFKEELTSMLNTNAPTFSAYRSYV